MGLTCRGGESAWGGKAPQGGDNANRLGMPGQLKFLLLQLRPAHGPSINVGSAHGQGLLHRALRVGAVLGSVLTEEDAEAQRGRVTCPGSHSP